MCLLVYLNKLENKKRRHRHYEPRLSIIDPYRKKPKMIESPLVSINGPGRRTTPVNLISDKKKHFSWMLTMKQDNFKSTPMCVLELIASTILR